MVDYMAEEPNNRYKVVVGTDSHSNGHKDKKQIDFVTALVIHNVGHGGRYFWRKETVARIHTLRQKIYQETYMSLGVAQTLLGKLQTTLENNGKKPKYEMEIHIDIGENGATRDMIKEIVGLVKGNGFHPKTKPDSFGASKVADKHA